MSTTMKTERTITALDIAKEIERALGYSRMDIDGDANSANMSFSGWGEWECVAEYCDREGDSVPDDCHKLSVKSWERLLKLENDMKTKYPSFEIIFKPYEKQSVMLDVFRKKIK